jgi:hypothetical protein
MAHAFGSFASWCVFARRCSIKFAVGLPVGEGERGLPHLSRLILLADVIVASPCPRCETAHPWGRFGSSEWLRRGGTHWGRKTPTLNLRSTS